MITNTGGRRPPIQMIDSEADALASLAIAAEGRLPQASELLLKEIARATVRKAGQVATNVVTMNATVHFVDKANDRCHVYQLVYPKEADISAGRISILTPVGAGLIGLREGQSILWPDRDGRERTLEIVKVTPP
ncbi:MULTISPECIES: nucleoside diphosphate kinase regulator [unclassified Novosphingobium]|uniref:nucleoside diphosphate kinase regulator n=1 Tax=unclassified Novosphingobium TaxID=2644732 RepID=UPI001F306F54|nr:MULTISPECIES: nucleoside diphosphate kinase regulator [unclassified Novosphingobium]